MEESRVLRFNRFCCAQARKGDKRTDLELSIAFQEMEKKETPKAATSEVSNLSSGKLKQVIHNGTNYYG